MFYVWLECIKSITTSNITYCSFKFREECLYFKQYCSVLFITYRNHTVNIEVVVYVSKRYDIVNYFFRLQYDQRHSFRLNNVKNYVFWLFIFEFDRVRKLVLNNNIWLIMLWCICYYSYTMYLCAVIIRYSSWISHLLFYDDVAWCCRSPRE